MTPRKDPAIVRAGKAAGGRASQRALAARRLPMVTEPPDPPLPRTRLREGIGPRFADCAHESACLDEFLAARPRGGVDADAFCPPRCQHRRPGERLRATDYLGTCEERAG